MKKLFLQAAFVACFLTVSHASFAERNDWQNLFTDIPTISLAEIEQRIDDLVLVDVRPKFDYDRKHRKGTTHMSFSSRMFMLQMEDLISKNQGKTIVVYCDTDNCIKSYRAVEKCRQEKLNNVVLFDLNKDMAEASQDKIYSQL